MTRRLVLALLGALCCAAAGADEPAAKVQKPLGTWELSADGHRVTFRFGSDDLRVILNAG